MLAATFRGLTSGLSPDLRTRCGLEGTDLWYVPHRCQTATSAILP